MNAFRQSVGLYPLSKTFTFLLVMVLVSACTTQKRRGDDTGALKKFYHNTTAKYNGYFNAKEILKESLYQLNTEYRDNYNKLLAIYPYMASTNPQSQTGSLDEAIQKVSVVVNLHRESHWTDDCYLLLGKAQFVKQNYEDAQEAFEFLAAEFSPEAMAAKEGGSRGKNRKPAAGPTKKKKSSSAKNSKKRKPGYSTGKKKKSSSSKKKKRPNPYSKKKKKAPAKKTTPTPKEEKTVDTTEKVEKEIAAKEKTKEEETDQESTKADEKAEKYFLKHRPAYQEGQVWLARTYIERDLYAEAEVILQKMDRDPLTYKDLRKEIAKAKAYLSIKKRELNLAIEPLEKAIELSKERSEKARLSYIVAQIHQQEGRGNQALASFERALKFSPDYEMEFSSRLNVAQNAWINGQATSEEALKTMKQMLKDSKNSEYKDQIYFAMAQIAIKEKDYAGGISYLKSALVNNVGNDAQAAESHLLLAQLYYDREDYVNSKYSYDSTLMVLPKNDERYKPTLAFRDNLTDIAKMIEIIALQDSLLAISAMTDQERKELAYVIQKEREAKRIAEATQKAQATAVSSSSRVSRSNVAPSTFFAYDDKKLRKGKKDFVKRWGDRPLEDNWRRSSHNNAGEELTATQQTEQINRELSEADIDQIFKDIPRTPEQIKEAEEKITNALFTLGTLYKDRLQKNDLAIETLEDLSNRFPGADKELEAWYFLYVIFNEEGNSVKAQEYYTKITNRYPKSLYAQALTDPDFKNKAEQEQSRLHDFYDDTYAIFQQGQYQNTVNRVVEATQTFGKTNELQPKFALLNAMSQGNLKGKEEYIKELKTIVAQFPDTEEQKRAKEILRLLGTQTVAGVNNEIIAEENNFEINDAQVHYFIIALKNNTIKLTDAKADVSDYNRKYHQLDRLRISNIYLGADTDLPILVIRRYKDKEGAMRYYNGILKNEQDFFESSVDYEMFAVSQSNYRQILKLKSLDEYKVFFQENYLDSN